MKPLILLALSVVLLFTGCQEASNTADPDAINAVIGNKSFIEKYGVVPDDTYDENFRIQTHLAYVEEMLRVKPTDHLGRAQLSNRQRVLDLLQDYWQDGQFPCNYDYPDGRRPCFIDQTGNICAVGYLVEQTAGRAFAERINSEYQYSYIYEMDDPALLAWAGQNGLTVEELATIQPSYWPVPNPQPAPQPTISTEYGIASSVLGGANMAFNTINIMQIGKGSTNKVVPGIGVLTGASQALMGVLMLSDSENLGRDARTLSYFNIGLGTSTLILSSYNLITNKKPKINRRTNFSVFPYETREQTVGIGVAFSRRF